MYERNSRTHCNTLGRSELLSYWGKIKNNQIKDPMKPEKNKVANKKNTFFGWRWLASGAHYLDFFLLQGSQTSGNPSVAITPESILNFYCGSISK